MIRELFMNRPLMAALIAWGGAQFLKLPIDWAVNKKFDLSRLWGDGGYPSAHSALVTALAAAAGKACGLDSPIFAVALVLAVVVMHDARGVRLETGKQARTINSILDVFGAWGTKVDAEARLKEMVGHTPLQVLAGAVVGVAVGVIY